MRNKIIQLYGAAFFIGLLLMIPNALAQGPIKLGAVLPLTEKAGAEGAKAMRLAVKEINQKGGVLGRPIELVVIDDEMRPIKGALAVEKLITEDKVDILVGGFSSGVHLCQIPIMKKYEKITVWIGGASSLCEQAVGPEAGWYFHLSPWDYQQEERALDGWTAINKRTPAIKIDRWFLAYEKEAYGSALFKANQVIHSNWKTPAGMPRLLGGESFTSAASGKGEYESALQKAQKGQPDIFMWAGYGADALPIMEQSRDMGFAPPIFIGAPPEWPDGFGKSPLAEGVVLYSLWAPILKEVIPASKTFWDAYTKEYLEDPSSPFAPLAYTNIYFVAEGIARAGTLEKAALIKALEKTKIESPVGETLSIEASRIIKHQGFIGNKILQWQKGQLQVIWPFEAATSQLVYPFPVWDKRKP
jgi:branched-chain amino acid transport system substrate-binding protein